jgi:hypothetical protein
MSHREGLAAPASTDYNFSGYLNALDAAGLIGISTRNPCNIVSGFCHYQFEDCPSPYPTGV